MLDVESKYVELEQAQAHLAAAYWAEQQDRPTPELEKDKGGEPMG